MFGLASSLLGRRSPAKPDLPPTQDRGTKRPASSPPSPALSETTVTASQDNEKPRQSDASLAKTVEKLQSRLEIAEVEIFSLKHQTEKLEIAARFHNLIAFEVDENLGIEGVRRLFAQGADLPAVSHSIREISRLGRYVARHTKPRPLRIIFNTLDARGAAFKHCAALRSRGVFLVEDLTPTQQATRKRLLPQLQALQAAGETAFFRGSNIIIRREGKNSTWVPGTSPPPQASQRPGRAQSPPSTLKNQGIPPTENPPASPGGSWADRVRQGPSSSSRERKSQPSSATGATGAAPSRRASAARPQQVPGGRTAAAPAGSSSDTRKAASRAAAAAAPPPPPPPPPATGATAAAPAVRAPAVRPQQAPGSRPTAASAGPAAGATRAPGRAVATQQTTTTEQTSGWQQVTRGRGRQGKPRPVKVALARDAKRHATYPRYSVRHSCGQPPKAAAPSTSSAGRHATQD